MTKIAGSISQRHGSADPDPDPPQNVMDPQHCLNLVLCTRICLYLFTSIQFLYHVYV
jgi:hypothetical protein